MFDPNAPDPFREVAPAPTPTNALQVNLTGMPVDQLIELRRQIEDMLPVKDLKDLNLARELVLQVQALQALQARVIEDPDVPVNQVAQCASALSSALVNLVKLQESTYTSERLKKIEADLVECIQTLPMATQTAFFERYEEALSA